MEKLCISENLEEFIPNNSKVLIFNRLTKKTYSIGQNEYKVLKNLDGTKTLEDVCLLNKTFSIHSIECLVNKFLKMGFIKNNEKKANFNILKIKKGIVNPDSNLNPNNIFLKIIYKFIVYLSIPIFIFGLLVGLKNFDTICNVIKKPIYDPNIFIIIPTMLVIVSLHELGHAIVAKFNGAFISEVGIMLYWFIPCAYTSIVGISYVKNKYKRALIFVAGIFVNLNLAGLGLIFTKFSTIRFYEYFLWFSLINISISISNLLIFLKFDGYYILEELLCINRLREKSFAYLKFIIKRKMKIGRITISYESYITNENLLNKIIYIVYGILSIVYIPFMLFLYINQIVSRPVHL